MGLHGSAERREDEERETGRHEEKQRQNDRMDEETQYGEHGEYAVGRECCRSSNVG